MMAAGHVAHAPPAYGNYTKSQPHISDYGKVNSYVAGAPIGVGSLPNGLSVKSNGYKHNVLGANPD